MRRLLQRLRAVRKKAEGIGYPALGVLKISRWLPGKLLKLWVPGLPHPVTIRRGTTDERILRYMFLTDYHYPPPEARVGTDDVILDLGANVGLSMLTYHRRYPGARIIGYEMDQDNCQLARQNTARYPNLEVHQAAVSAAGGRVRYQKSGRPDGYSTGVSEDRADVVEVPAFTFSDILTRYELTEIAFLKMDIEGSEWAILEASDLGWLASVRSFHIEFHGPDAGRLASCVARLEGAGFVVSFRRKHPFELVGYRP